MAEVDFVEVTAAFPVVFNNGVRRITVGNVKIHPKLDYKQFRLALNHMIGISHNNLTTYLVDTERDLEPEQRKILITGKVDLSGLVQEKTCYFFVVLKRARRERRIMKPNKQPGPGLPPSCRFTPSHILLGHLDMNDVQIPASATFFGKIQFQELQIQRAIQRANYINSMIMNWNCGFHWPINTNFPKMMESCPGVQSCRNRELCVDCTNADRQGEEPEIHLRFGPIYRPRPKL